jgi:hypothetical protein
VVTACSGIDTGSTPVPVTIDIPTQTASKIKSEPTAASMPLPVATPTSATNAPTCKDLLPEAKEVPARGYILNL